MERDAKEAAEAESDEAVAEADTMFGAEATETAHTPRARATSESELEPGVAVGRYVVERRVGAGGMGVVYAARDPELDRRVALKFLHETDSGDDGSREQRLRREAKVMARLSHPNVAAVYDVGTHDGRVFLAMEFVEGPSLRRWCEREDRGWREILPTFRDAARGLAAAHEAGVVHRDFKPDNVIVGAAGPKVTDFGLAAVGSAPVETEGGDDALVSPGALTQTGAVMGTPSYMSPEQHLGGGVDARSDQFSFCATLYHALYRKLPFEGDSYTELAAAATEGRIAEPPPRTGSGVPAWLDRVVRKGLSVDRERRFASMAALLEALERGMHRRRRVAMAVAAAAVAGVMVAGAAALGARDASAPSGAAAAVCAGAERHMDGVWDAERAARLEARFAGDPAYARALWPGVRAQLDAYRDAWIEAHTEACRATRVHGEHSERILELRMTCLERQRTELREVGELLETGETEVRARAPKMVPPAEELARCADTAALGAVVAPPPDASAPQVAALRERHDRLRVRYRAGRYEEIRPELEALVEDARALGYGPLLAEALELQGSAFARSNHAEESIASLREAASTALASRHDVVAAKSWAAVIYPLAVGFDRFEESEQAAQLARSAIERLGGDRAIEAVLDNNLGLMEWMREDYPRAREHLERAVALREELYGTGDYRVASSLDNLGSVLHYLGDEQEATRAYERALDIRETSLGDSHPDVARTLTNLSMQYNAEGRHEEAARMLERAVTIKEATLGADNPGVGTSLFNLGNVYLELGRHDDAATSYRRAAALFERESEPRWDSIGVLGVYEGESMLWGGHPAEAIPVLERGRELLAEHGVDDRRNRSRGELALAHAHALLGDYAAARAAARRATALDAELAADDPKRAAAIGALGRVEARAGNTAAARRHLERALAVHGERGGTFESGRARGALARLLWAQPAERARSLELARAALADYTEAGGRATRARERLAAWLAERSPGE